MSKVIDTHIDIHAPAERVWRGLTDFAEYPQWNPFLRRVKGGCELGGRISIHCYPPGWFPLFFRPVITNLEPERELRWVGGFLSPRIAQGEHVFALESVDAETVHLHHYERFTGVAIGLVAGLMGARVTRGFEMMNEALKAWAEA